jgi:predicted Zn-dependent protease
VRRAATALLTLSLVLVIACATVPVTGRKQLSLVSDAEMQQMSYQQYEQVIAESQLSDDQQAVDLVERVGRNIQHAVEEFFAERGQSDHLDGYAWEFHLIESEQVNAWCMPGGKVAFYTGILPVCQDEVGVAVVMGHEVAHAIAEHGSERMSQGLAQQLGGVALSEALGSEPETTREIAMAAFALGTQYGALLPYSRLQESEADHLGLIFMAMAGYDPREAPRFWQRMAAQGGEAPPEFMSTHPSSQSRVENLREKLPEALEYYQP